jgi:hypothetical protein
MRPSFLRAFAAGGALVVLAATVPGRSAPDAGRVPLTLVASEPRLVPTADGAVVPEIDGFGLSSRPGEPALPLRILMVAIPDGVAPSLAILRTASRDLPGIEVAPVPASRVRDRDEIARALLDGAAASASEGRGTRTPGPDASDREWRRDPVVYARDAFFPDAPVRLGRVGWLRDQRFVEVFYSPILYNPARGEARLFTRVDAEVRFDLPEAAAAGGEPGTTALPPGTADAHFESAYAAALYNYDQGRLFRSRRGPGGAQPDGDPGRAGIATDGALPAMAPADAPAGPRYKLSVTQEGVYRLDQSWLAANAPDILAADPRTLAIEVDGAEIPIAIRNAAGGDGEADGVFDAGDVVEFHGGPKVEEATTPNYNFADPLLPDIYEANDFTDTQVCWLSASGAAGSHRRIPDVSGAPAGDLPLAADFEATAAWNENNFFLPLGDGDPYVSIPSLLAGGPAAQRDISMPLPGLAPPGATASIAVRLRGGTSLTADPDHRTRVWTNADLVNVDEFDWDGEVDKERVLSLPQGSLTNPVTVHLLAPGLPGVTVDRQYPDSIVVTYRRQFTAVGDALVFRFPNQDARFQVGGLGASAPVILEISRIAPENGEPDPVRIVGATPAGAPTSSWIFEVSYDAAPGAPAVRTFIVAGPAAWMVPAAVEPAQPAALKVAGQAADFVVIAARSAVDASPGGALDNLLAHRLAAQGLTSKVVYIDQVYDEFSGGRRDANAIRAFLAWAYLNWRGPTGTDDPPAYVLLVGDATLDYKNNLARADWIDQVPTPILLQKSNIIGYFSSDNWLASFNGPDQIPDIHLGRITTRTPAASAGVFDKIRLFEAATPIGTWKGRGVLSAGDGKIAGEDLSFQAINDTLRQDYFTQAPFSSPSPPLYFPPPPWSPTQFADFHDSLDGEIEAGAAVLTYVGHGSFDTWGYDDSFYTTADAAALTNGLRLPFMLNINCLSGGFHYLPASGSFAEGFVNNPAGGAVAAFAPSGLSNAFVGTVVADELFLPLLGPLRDRTLGPATFPVRTALWGRGSIVDAQSYTFLGDPASLLSTPAPEPPLGLTAVAGNGEVALAWTPPVVPAAATRLYRAATNPAGPYAPIACTPTGPASCLDTTVINATRYYYHAVSVDAEGFEGRWSNSNSDCDAGPDCVTALPVNPNPPAAPTGLQVVDPGTGGRLDVAWNASPENDVKRYTVRYGTSSGVYTFSANVLPPAASVALQGLTDGVRYYVTVTATNTADLESAPAAEQSGVPHLFEGIAPPRIISDLTVSLAGSDLALTWSRPMVDIYGRPTTVVGYRVYRGATADFAVSGTTPLAVINDGAVTTYTHVGGATLPGDSYYIVTAFDAAGFVSGAGHDLPNGIGDLDVTFVAPSTVHLAWSPITTDVQGYPNLISHYQIHVTATPAGRAALGAATLLLDNVGATTADLDLPANPRYISVLAVDIRGNLSPF